MMSHDSKREQRHVNHVLRSHSVWGLMFSIVTMPFLCTIFKMSLNAGQATVQNNHQENFMLLNRSIDKSSFILAYFCISESKVPIATVLVGLPSGNCSAVGLPLPGRS